MLDPRVSQFTLVKKFSSRPKTPTHFAKALNRTDTSRDRSYQRISGYPPNLNNPILPSNSTNKKSKLSKLNKKLDISTGGQS